jgi:hypothetical protein
MEADVALKPITLRLDEEEYEQLKEHLSSFGDPDINTAYVLRSYIRDLNRALPFVVNSGWELKNYFGFMGAWLKQMVTMTDTELLGKGMFNWWQNWNPMAPPSSGPGDTGEGEERKPKSGPKKKEGGERENK